MDDFRNVDLDNLKFLQEHAWEYFKLHANQRLLLLRFYILFLTLFATGASFMYVRYPSVRFMEELAGIVLSLAFAFITVMFHLLDRRNRQLIHYAEDALRVIESDNKFPSVAISEKLLNCKELKIDHLKVFIREDCDRYREDCCVRHTTCFKAIFVAGYVLAGLFFVASLSSMFYYSGLAAYPTRSVSFPMYHY